MPAPPAARPDAIRRHNLALVLDHIHRDGALTRAELTQRLKVSRSTMGALVADLIELGLVDEVVPTGGSGVGRPSHVVGPHPAGPYVVAVDIDVTQVITAAIGIGGVVLARHVVTTGVEASTPMSVAGIVVDSMQQVSKATDRELPPLGIGVSVPGTVDRLTGRVAVAPNLDWHDVAFGALLADLLPSGMNVAVGNDADLAVLAEHRRGRVRDVDDVVFLLGRIGVGAGIIIGGLPVRGRDGHAGEIGHNVLDPTGPECHCGQRGCIETFLGENALLELAGRRLPRTDAKVAALFKDARNGDVDALRAIESASEPLGRAIAHLLNTLNPERVLLGASLGEILELARPAVEAAVERYTFGGASPGVALLLPAFGGDSALLGAAEVAFTGLLADPR